MLPRDVNDVSMVFGANAVEDLMPSYEACKAGLDALPRDERRKWVEFQQRWFFEGLPKTVQVGLRVIDGKKVDGDKAFRHLASIQGSFAPKHEHKEAAVAYLASQWFEDVAYDGFDAEADRAA